MDYARVSSTDQNLDRQVVLLGNVDKLFTDEVSGVSRAHRAGLARLLEYVREDDEVIVVSMDGSAAGLGGI